MTVAFNQQNRCSATLLYLTLMISLSGCGGTEVLRKELKDAEREREVLRPWSLKPEAWFLKTWFLSPGS